MAPTTKCFVPQYVTPPGNPLLPAADAMFTRCPRLREIIRGMISFMPKRTPWMLMSI